VACFATDDVRAIAPDLATRASPRPAGDGPIALALVGGDVWAAASLSGSLSRLPLPPSTTSQELLVGGKDFEGAVAAAGKLLLANAGAGSLVVFDPASSTVVDELPLGATALVNPKGIAYVGGAAPKVFVSLYGDSATGNPAVGQAVVVLGAGGLAACGMATGPGHCLTLDGTLDVSAGADAPGLAFPGRAVTVDSRVYVTISNLKLGSFGFFTDPAGPGRLAVIDGATDALGFVSLGAGCGNPGGVAAHGHTIWVACGAFGASGLVEVDVSVDPPVVSAVHAAPVLAPGNVTFCADRGFLTDQYSGDVYPFLPLDYAASPAAATTVCPVSAGPNGFAWAADVVCASRP